MGGDPAKHRAQARENNGTVLPGPSIDGTNLVVTPHALPGRRTWWQEQLYSLGKLVVLGLSLVLAVGNMAYRASATVTFGAANRAINFLSCCLTHLLACCLRRRTPAGLPYSLPNVLQPAFRLPREPCEAVAAMFFARLAYEDPGNRRDILADSLQRAGAAAVMTIHNDSVVARGYYPHRLHLLGRALVDLDVRRNRDHFDTQAFVGTYQGHPVVVFRGTEPLSLVDWSTDFTLGMEATAGLGRMHSGFKHALGIAQSQLVNQRPDPASLYCELCRIVNALSAAPTSSGSHRPRGTIVYVTGHSLGAALAATFAAHYMRDHPNACVRAYPFAQPRAGDGEFCTCLEALVATRPPPRQPRRVFRRFVNNNDIIPRSAATMMGYCHEPPVQADRSWYGCEAFYIDAHNRLYRLPRGYWSEAPPFETWTAFTKLWQRRRSEPLLRRALWLPSLPFLYGLFLNDHMPGDYAEGLERNTVDRP